MTLARWVVVGVFLHLLAANASAQQVVQQDFSVQLFEPAIGVRDNFFTVESATVPDHLDFGLGLILNYQHRPLVLFVQPQSAQSGGTFDIEKATPVDVVSNHFSANLGGAIGLQFKWLHAQIGVDLPINLLLMGKEVNAQGQVLGNLSGTSGLGDLRLQLKASLLREWHGLSLALSPIVTFPTARSDSFGGDPFVSFQPRVVVDYRIGDLLAAINVGTIIRESTTIFSSEIGHRLLYGAAAGYRLHKRLFVMAEVFGQAGFNTKSDCRQNPNTGALECESSSFGDLDAYPLELDMGGHINVARGLDITAGAGFGLIKAVGSPVYRLIAGIRWSPDIKDTDGDGVFDYNDRCPNRPEDKDGYQDRDGCPDPDNDGDLIPDIRDKCPDEAEDKDGFKDEDGCPEPDNDGDGIPDLRDACPFQPENINGIKDKDGCPDIPDEDEDGIADKQDKCPKDPEDKDGFQDEDGCPDPDNDGDGVPDSFDDCPLAPEDSDSFQDDDGCPDPDNDGDGVPDKTDKCPDKPETINGYKDDDGCPDKGEEHVVIKEQKIVITKQIFFATDTAKIMRISHGILNEIALTLNANPQIKSLRVEGHTDSSGKAGHNRQLSQERAEAVRDFLVQAGVDAGRLFAAGFGSERPVKDNRTARGRAANRRVEFTILGHKPTEKQPQATDNSD
ncbi:MAG: OmpA family protein [Pseudomonadota bacterium]